MPNLGNVSATLAGQTENIYSFTLNSFKITDTRARHNDTDFVAISIKVGANDPIIIPTKSMGDVNNGVHQVNLTIPNIEADANTVVAFSYSIVNSGHSQDKVGQALQTVVSAASSKAASAGAALVGGLAGGPGGALITAVGTPAAAWVLGKLGNIIFADCDGTVAAADHVFTGAQLAQKTAGGIFTMDDDNQGTNSATGCGSNSRYFVTWSIQSHRAAVQRDVSRSASGQVRDHRTP